MSALLFVLRHRLVLDETEAEYLRMSALRAPLDMKDPYTMTLAEWDALWTFAPTKAEKAEVHMTGARRLQRQRDEAMIQAWRAGHELSTCSDATAQLLAEMELSWKRLRDTAARR